MTVWNAHVSSDICTDPIRYIFLVHGNWMWISVSKVGSGSWEIQTILLNLRFYSVGKLGIFTTVWVRISWVSEIKITCKCVLIRCRRFHRSCFFFFSLWFTNFDSFVKISRMLRTICLRTNYFFWWSLFFPSFVLFSSRWWFWN